MGFDQLFEKLLEVEPRGFRNSCVGKIRREIATTLIDLLSEGRQKCGEIKTPATR
jgi:hypothetical protein